jgi:hypothetical protein
MRSFLVAVLVAVAAAVIVLCPAPARADDEPGLPDGGSIVTSADGGAYAIADLGARGCWTMAIRCEGAQSTRYTTCATSSCTAAAVNQLLDADRTFDIPVNCVAGQTRKRYLALKTDDAGVPFCKVQRAQ